MARVVRPRVSYADLQRMPEDGPRYELYDGEVFVVPAPVPRHQRVTQHIVELLTEYERATGGLVLDSPVDIVLSEHDVVQPDVVFFRQSRRGELDMRAPARIPPDLAVEVLSPSTEANDRGRKMQMLARYGVPEYWIVDPVGNRFELHVLREGGYVLEAACSEADEVRSVALPDLHFPASQIFTE